MEHTIEKQPFKRYEAYKDSGVEWIGEVPEHWEVVRIKSISRVRRGASPRPIADPKYFDNEGEFAWVRIEDVSSAYHYLMDTKERLSRLGSSLSIKLFPGALFLSIAGSVGKAIISKIKACIHDGFVYFPNLNEQEEYLFRIFEAENIFVGLGKTGTQLNLNTQSIGNIRIPLPPLPEQQAIARFLDEKCAQIDKAIAQKERLIELLKERQQIIIQQAVTKGLDPQAKMKDSGVEWIGEVPEDWEVVRLKYILKERNERTETGEEPLTYGEPNSWVSRPFRIS